MCSNRLRLSVAALLLGLCARAGAASPEADWYARLRFEHLTVTEGLPSNWVHSILRDSAGFVWFGTHQGLARYDGAQLSIYKSQPDDARALPAPLIGMLYEDREKRLWVGFAWAGQGLALYQRECDCFRRYGSGERGHDVRAMTQDRRGRLWVGTEDGVSAFDPATGAWTVHSIRAQEGNPPDPVVNGLAEDRSGRLWVGTNGGLLRFDPETGKYERWPGTSADRLSLAGVGVWDLLLDPDGTIWAATIGSGLYRLVPDNMRIMQHYLPAAADPQSIASARVRRLLRDTRGQIYVGTENGGMDVLSVRGRFTHYVPDIEDKGSLDSWSVWAMHLDEQGTLWIGTHNGGMNWTSTDGQRFHAVEALRGGLSDPHVSAVLKDHLGRLWIGTDGGGLNELDRSTGRFTHYRHRLRDAGSLGSDAVQSILEDSRGDLWTAGWDAGLGRLDRTTDKVTVFRNDPANPQSLISDNVWTVRELKSGELLVGTQNGADLFDRATQRFRHVSALYADVGDGTTQAVAEDPSGGVWLCGYGFSHDATIVHIDRKASRIDHYRSTPEEAGGLTPGWCLSVWVDSTGNLWAGTQGGLSVRPAGGARFQRWQVPHSLAADEVTNVIEDRSGNIWATMGQSVLRFKNAAHLAVDPSPDVFDRNDGFRGPVPPGAISRAEDGEIFVGGISGFTTFRSESVEPNPIPPRVVLTDIKVMNRSLRACTKGSPLEEAAPMAQALTLPWHASVISFEFAALNFRLPQKNRYAYKLEGFDRDWSFSGSRHEATYTNLSPGQYTLRVKAANNDGVWNENGLQLRLRLTPPFWATWWFRLLVGSIAVAWGARLYQQRVRALSARASELSARMEERTRLARELHDTFEQALAGIRLQLAVAIKNLRPDPEKSAKNLELARRMLAYCIEDARRTVMDMRSQSLEDTDLGQALAEESRRMVEETPLKVDVAVKGARHRLEATTEHHLLRIAQEALTNAIKHSGGDRVQIDLCYEDAATVLVVRDNGQGLQAGMEPRGLHFGLQGMRERAERMGGTLALGRSGAGGVEVTVSVPRSPNGGQKA